MNRIAIEKNILEVTNSLIRLGEEICWNKFSNNIGYLVRHVPEKDQILRFVETKKKIIDVLKKKKLYTSPILANEIVKYQKKIGWIDLILIYSSNQETIILAELIYGKRKDDLNFHASIATPNWYIDKKEKFDLNWYLNELHE